MWEDILKDIRIKEKIKVNIIEILDTKPNEIITIRINMSNLRSEITQLINLIAINEIFQNFYGIIYSDVTIGNKKYIITSTKIKFTKKNIKKLWNNYWIYYNHL